MQGELWISLFAVGFGSFLLTVLLGRVIIPILRGHKIGQIIREEGPSSHFSKAGTPTMGGICFIIAILLAVLGAAIYLFLQNRQSELIPLALTLALAVANGLIGFVDDFCKLMKKQNEGLKAYQKFILQVLAAVLYLLARRLCGFGETALHIPFTSIYWELGIFYDFLAAFLIVGMVNSVNLTDGIDGLASTVTLVVFGFFTLCAFRFSSLPLLLLSAALMGGMLGFLVYNHHPAKVFMGDTGSLFLGGAVSGAAIMLGSPLLVLIVGGVNAVETLSVILQVISFQTTGKRIFRMTPIHHHFEKCDWSENKIVTVFSFVTFLLCAVAYFAI